MLCVKVFSVVAELVNNRKDDHRRKSLKPASGVSLNSAFHRSTFSPAVYLDDPGGMHLSGALRVVLSEQDGSTHHLFEIRMIDESP